MTRWGGCSPNPRPSPGIRIRSRSRICIFWTDALKSQTYPSGRTVSYDVDNAGRVTKVAAGSRTYAGMTRMDGVIGDAYAPDGRLRQMKLGNNLWETRDYGWLEAPQGQPRRLTTRFKLGTSPGTSERLELGYNYHATANNGNLIGHTITRTGTDQTTNWTQTFGYDGVNRLETARETNGYSRTFNYDRYGNRWVAPNLGMRGGRQPRAGGQCFRCEKPDDQLGSHPV